MINNVLFQQVYRFIVIGLLAALLHVTMVITLVEQFWIAPLLANIIAFLGAFQISYLGHRYWTFRQLESRPQSFARFFLVALAGFTLNELLFFVLLKVSHLNYVSSLIIVLAIVPTMTFIFSKFWAFRTTSTALG